MPGIHHHGCCCCTCSNTAAAAIASYELSLDEGDFASVLPYCDQVGPSSADRITAVRWNDPILIARLSGGQCRWLAQVGEFDVTRVPWSGDCSDLFQSQSFTNLPLLATLLCCDDGTGEWELVLYGVMPAKTTTPTMTARSVVFWRGLSNVTNDLNPTTFSAAGGYSACTTGGSAPPYDWLSYEFIGLWGAYDITVSRP